MNWELDYLLDRKDAELDFSQQQIKTIYSCQFNLAKLLVKTLDKQEL